MRADMVSWECRLLCFALESDKRLLLSILDPSTLYVLKSSDESVMGCGSAVLRSWKENWPFSIILC